MPRLTLTLLGSIQAALDGRPVTAFDSDKVRALLAFLAVESDRPHSREKLAGLLWPESTEAAARASLSRALTNLRVILGDRQAGPPILLADRQTVQFSREAGAWVDVSDFRQRIAAAGAALPHAAAASLRAAADLYRGRFLEGFSLPGCPELEEWLLLEQEHLHRLATDALARLAAAAEKEDDLPQAIAFTWRRLDLDPWCEPAHRAAMRLLARSGRRDAALAQGQTCRRILAEELGAEPSAETTRLFAQIRDQELPAEPSRLDLPPRPPPAFLSGRPPPNPRPIFVAREAELARLEGWLSASLAGGGQMAFVVGGPGRGKTALLHEFAHRAMDAHPDLLLAIGSGGAYAGVGDPYLPFREALAMLSGDVEGPWAAGTLSADHARRLWSALPQVATVLAERGSGLIGTLLPARDLLSRVRAAVPPGAPCLQHIEHLAALQAPAQGLEQSNLFEQYANVLLDLSAHRPLLILLDDLQWADLASIGLLFLLGCRIDRSRILLVGTYRPHELALGRDGDRHPLEPVLAELRSRFGDTWLDLAAADEADGRTFIDRLLDTEPNVLGERFRAALLRRTGGHPLFTIELLRAMQERGSLRRDEQARWIEAEPLDWEMLPARAEAAIAERIARLPEELRELLTAASVEGEEFTAQAVALVQGLDELQALRLLRQELATRHRLVRKQGETKLDGRSPSHYRFTHFLVQHHLYQGLGDGERRLLHRRVGEALEGLYEGHLGEAAVHLARHFAGDPERERRYARLAGERAAAQFANEEAVRYFSRALELTPGSEVGAQYDLLAAREKLYDVLGRRDAQQRDLATLELLAEGLDVRAQAEAARRRSIAAYHCGDYAAAISAARHTLRRARKAKCPDLEAWGHLVWGGPLSRQGDAHGAMQHYLAGLALARRHGLRGLEARLLVAVGGVRPDPMQGLIDNAEALRVAQEAGDREVEWFAISNVGWFSAQLGELGRAADSYERCVRFARESGDLQSEAYALSDLGFFCLETGDSAQARVYLRQALRMAEEVEDRHLVAADWCGCADASCCLGEMTEAEGCAQQALSFAREIAAPGPLGQALSTLGRILGKQGNSSAARECYDQAVALLRQGSMPGDVMDALAGLATLCLTLGETAQARVHVHEILAHLDAGGRLTRDCRPYRTYLACYRVLLAAVDPRAAEILDRGYAQLQEWAATIPDEDLRRSFLENVPENREIVRLWAAEHAGAQAAE